MGIKYNPRARRGTSSCRSLQPKEKPQIHLALPLAATKRKTADTRGCTQCSAMKRYHLYFSTEVA